MKAIFYEKNGGAEVLQYGDRPQPEVKKGQLLVRVHAASVNPVDWKLRENKLLSPVTALSGGVVPGRDLAGDVVETGEGVTRFKTGDKVFGMLDSIDGGAYAEFALIPEAVAEFIPDNISYLEAAAVPLVSPTALQALRDKGELTQGEHVLVNGASSAVGLFAVQLAKLLGATEVTGVCSTAHVDLVKEVGADRVIDYKKEDFTEEKNRYDLIFDAVAKSTFASSKGSLRENGRFVTTVPSPKDILGFATSVFSDKKAKSLLVADKGPDLFLIGEWLQAGKLKVIIDKVYPLQEAAEAHRYSEQGEASGKIVLDVK
ncbi:NAD(P)-dependent alcohol dehydrogenase [Pontibacter qinzhouensis]|uniref:NAD(P)-dependent alcohol dehydrogenase n=1 Tax=Pontibacter qinzhouensis TaxID=2603253 RepID=A0A5C8IRA6_9BACT|nr:NAD(P)-dependent alcohol dehydrogenase [Pontibacter qinzhouensis]TXK23594.1 NAD(P)-dependent alcohol dehydrogenase [Pontibacter qinzhouensis]